MSRTLVPPFDHVANADLCNKRATPNQPVSGFWGQGRSMTHIHTDLGWNQTSFRRRVVSLYNVL